MNQFRLSQIALLLGFILLPFSTPPKGETSWLGAFFPALGSLGVFHYGLPFLSLGSCLLLIAGRHSTHPPSGRLPFLLVGGLYMLCVGVFSLYAVDRIAALARAVTNAIGAFGCFALLSVGIEEGKPEKSAVLGVGRAISLSGAVLAGYFLINFGVQGTQFSQIELFSERYVGGAMGLPWGASNTIASTLLMPLIVSFCLLEYEGRRMRLLVSIALQAAAILLTLSRNGWLCAAAFVALYLVLVPGRRWLGFAAACCSASLLMLVAAGSETFEYVLATRLQNVENIRVLGGRTEIWTTFTEYILDNPLSPVGYYGSLSRFDLSAHNLILCTYVEMGPIGLAAVLMCGALLLRLGLIQCWSANTKLRNASRVLVLGAMVIFANLQFEDPHFTQPYIIYVWFFLGFAVALLTDMRLFRASLASTPTQSAIDLRAFSRV